MVPGNCIALAAAGPRPLATHLEVTTMRLDYKRTFLLGFGFFGVSIIWSVYNSFVPILLQDYALPYWLIGFIMTFDNIAGIFIQPYIGQLSDHTRTRLGRRMPYILVGAPVAAVFFGLIPIIHQALGQSASALALLMGAIIVMNIAMAIFRTPVVALMPDITPSPQRSKANGIINLMGGVGTTIAFGMAVLFTINRGLPFWVAAVVLLVCEGIVLLTIREPRQFTAAEGEASKPPSFGESLRDLFRTVGEVIRAQDKSTIFICLAIFAWFMGYNAIETFWTLYGRNYLFAAEVASGALTGDAAAAKAGSMMIFISGAFLLFALPAGFIATRFGRKPTIMAGLGALAVLWTGVRFFPNMPYVYATLILSGVAWALININSLPIVADLASDEKIGSYTGLYYLFSLLAASTSPTVVGWLMDLFGMEVMFIFTPAFMVLAFLFMLGVKRSEPRQVVASLGQAVETAGNADF
jgi:maltose/moltooligosaccharide transporter